MGYSHSWGRPSEIPVLEFQSWLDDVRRIIACARPLLGLIGGIRVAGPAGNGQPQLEPARVALNGLLWGAHESFIVHRRIADYRPTAEAAEDGMFWDACKTNQKPYDAVVVAILLAFVDRVSTSKVSSDGTRDDWHAGASLFGRALERDPAPLLERVFRPL